MESTNKKAGFCDNEKLISKTEYQPVKRKSRKQKKRKKFFYVLIVFAVLIVAAGIAAAVYPLLSPQHNPDRFVKAYLGYASQRNWDIVYEFLPSLDSPYITRESFDKFISESSEDELVAGIDADDFIIEREKTDGDKIYYRVDYINTNGNWQTTYIKVKKIKDGFWKYDSYRIVPDKRIICDAQIYAPAGAKVYVDSTEVTSFETVNETDPKTGKEVSANVFTTDYMFSGSHNIKVQCDGFNDYENSVQIDDENSNIYISLNMSAEKYNSLMDEAKTAVQAVYAYACGGEEVDKNIFSSEFAENSLEELYSEAKNSMYSDSKYIVISDFAVNDVNAKSEYEDISVSYNSSDDCYVNFEFNYSYKIKNKFDGLSESRSDTGYAAVKYIYENSKWVIDDIAARAIF